MPDMSSGTPTTNDHTGAPRDVHSAIDAVWRIESPRLIAGLARITRDVGAAQDLAQDALVAALGQWPREGVPTNPGAWLMAAAKNRAIDLVRRGSLLERKHGELGRELVERQENSTPDYVSALDDDIASVTIIPHTYHATNLQSVKAGAKVNLECDVIAKYVERMMIR